MQPVPVGPLPQPLTVAAPERPPFASRGVDQSWEGIGIDLWRTVAEELEIAYRIVPVPPDGIEAALAAGEIDVAIALDATPSAIDNATLTIPYYTATLGLAAEPERVVLRIMRNAITPDFVRFMGWLFAVLLVTGALVWIVERRRNPQFAAHPLIGLGDGFWWAVVTLTTTGYGDKAPLTFAGRSLAILWMLVGLAVSTALTAAIVAAAAVVSERTVTIPTDVVGRRIAVVSGSSAEAYLTGFRLTLVPVDDINAGIATVHHGGADALAGGAPELSAALQRHRSRLSIAATRQDPQYVVFGLSPRLPPATSMAIQRAVVDRITSDDWWTLVQRYLPSGR
jgi:ABC-type amino acid transport substrate-binding protein